MKLYIGHHAKFQILIYYFLTLYSCCLEFIFLFFCFFSCPDQANLALLSTRQMKLQYSLWLESHILGISQSVVFVVHVFY